MKRAWIVAVLACAVLASGVWAQGITSVSPRAVGMGGVGIAVCDDAAAWFQNPAGLAALDVPCGKNSEWGHDVLLGYMDAHNDTGWLATWSGSKPKSQMGFGAGFFDIADIGTMEGVGFGMGLGKMPLSLGINIEGQDLDAGQTHTVLNVGALYRFGTAEGQMPVRVGLYVNDIGDESDIGQIWSFGVAAKVTPDLLVALDVIDITDERDMNSTFDMGAEYAFGSKKEWRVRLGGTDLSEDAKIAAGAGYVGGPWRVDIGYLDADKDPLFIAGVGMHL